VSWKINNFNRLKKYFFRRFSLTALPIEQQNIKFLFKDFEIAFYMLIFKIMNESNDKLKIFSFLLSYFYQ